MNWHELKGKPNFIAMMDEIRQKTFERTRLPSSVILSPDSYKQWRKWQFFKDCNFQGKQMETIGDEFILFLYGTTEDTMEVSVAADFLEERGHSLAAEALRQAVDSKSNTTEQGTTYMRCWVNAGDLTRKEINRIISVAVRELGNSFEDAGSLLRQRYFITEWVMKEQIEGWGCK